MHLHEWQSPCSFLAKNRNALYELNLAAQESYILFFLYMQIYSCFLLSCVTDINCQYFFADSGKLVRSLAVATSEGAFLTVDQIIYNVIGFTIAAVSTAAITIYAKKALQKLQAEDELC
jgi:hypothetical protein